VKEFLVALTLRSKNKKRIVTCRVPEDVPVQEVVTTALQKYKLTRCSRIEFLPNPQ